MKKLQVNYDTYPVNPALDPSGGYAMRLTDQQILEDDAVYEEVIKEETLPLSVKLLKFCVNAVLAATSKKTSQDCRPRRVGDELKFVAFPRGKLTSPYGAFDPATCSAVVLAMPLKGVSKKVDLTRVQFVNTKTGTKVMIDRIVYEGCMKSEEIATIMVGKGIVVTGLNCQYLPGDKCIIAWHEGTEPEKTAEMVPTSSSVTEMRFAWPTALDGVAPGTEVEVRFTTRGGVEDADPQTNKKVVTLIGAAA